jgi:FSR family fosmidomycin resistance protein-like MFS transporter
MRRRSLSVLSIGHLTVDVTSGALPAALPFLQHEFQLSYLLLAIVATTYQVTSSITQPLFGLLSDAGTKRFLVPLGVLLAAAGFSAIGLAPTYALLLCAIALAGIGSAMFHPEATKSARFVAGASRATGMAFFSIGGNVGVALGPLVLIGIVAWRGLSGTWIYAIVGLCAAAVVAATGRWIAHAETQWSSASLRLRMRSRPGAMAVLVAVVALRSVVYSGILVFVPLYSVNVLHHSPAANGPLLFAIMAAGALSTIVGAAIADRTSHRRTMIGSFAFVPPLIAIYVLDPTAVGVAALIAAGGFLIATTTVSVIMAQEFMPNRIALASSLVIGFTSGIGGLGIAALGGVADVAGVGVVLWAIVGAAVAGTAVSFMLPDSAPAPTGEDAAGGARILARSIAQK